MNTTADNTQDRMDDATAADVRAEDRCVQCNRLEEGHGSRSAVGSLIKKPTPSIMSHQFMSSRNLPATTSINEAQYNVAIRTLAEQVVAMAREDAESEDDRELEVRSEEYAADALADLQAAVRQFIKEKK